MKYKLQTFKLTIEGEFETEEQAIKELSDNYMRCSKCNPPNQHPAELIMGVKPQEITKERIEKIGKTVWFYVWEQVYGKWQWIEKYKLSIHPFRVEHWWESTIEPKFVPQECEFKYEIIEE